MDAAMIDAEHHRGLERLYATAPITQWYGTRILISDGQAEVRSGVFARSAISLDPTIGYA
jgi:hypothetical protein